MTTDDGLAGLRVLVTAGAAGIGRRVAERFAEAGRRVHVCDADEAALATVRPGIGRSLCDVTVEHDVDRLFDEVKAALGGLDVLVANAGIAGPTGGLETLELDAWQRCIAVTLDGSFLAARRAIPLLEAAGGGSIVLMSSTAGLFGFPNRTPYAAAKWAIIGLAKSLAMELGPRGIRVNAICPGSVEGPRIERVIAADAAATGRTPEEVRRLYESQVSLRTFVTTDDIADTILHICSVRGRRISGQALAVDGHTETLA